MVVSFVLAVTFHTFCWCCGSTAPAEMYLLIYSGKEKKEEKSNFFFKGGKPVKGWHTCDQHCFNENLWTVAVTDSVHSNPNGVLGFSRTIDYYSSSIVHINFPRCCFSFSSSIVGVL